MYKISIVIPTHNRPELLEIIIKKFLKIKNVEIIIVENGSDKKEKNKYLKYERKYEKYENVKFFFNNWGSLSKARIFGAKMANSDYIFNCDDDDMPTTKFIDWLNINKLDKFFYRFNILYKNKETKKYRNVIPKSNIVKYIMQVSTWIAKKEFLLKIYKKINLPTNLVMGEDQILSIALLKEIAESNQKIQNINLCSVIYDFNFGIKKVGIITGEGKKSNFHKDKLILDYLLQNTDLKNEFWKKTYKKMLRHFATIHIKKYENKRAIRSELKIYKKKLTNII